MRRLGNDDNWEEIQVQIDDLRYTPGCWIQGRDDNLNRLFWAWRCKDGEDALDRNHIEIAPLLDGTGARSNEIKVTNTEPEKEIVSSHLAHSTCLSQ